MPYKDAEARRAYQREYKAARREQMQALNRESYERHKVAILARRKVREAATDGETRRATFRAYGAGFRRKHQERLKTKALERRRANPEQQRAYERKYRTTHPERQVAAKARYFRNHPERAKALQSERSARRTLRKRSATVGRISYITILERDKGICHICKQAIDTKDLHFDHIIPLARGGPHTTGNIAVAHSWCNLRKHTKLL